MQFAKFFFANIDMYNQVTEDLPVDLLKNFAPFASSVMIRQNFAPQIFPMYAIGFSKFVLLISADTFDG